ncbi:2OG-Fe(II) oxygenase [Blastopirellula sp. JC732]|uniref:2OG-Fe(II) oxygenase n=1 Tax=Blastopirellula sediminis TaxID=2894196 RepID=A0A9X1SH62_9BACT|nr:2OG-Fe(II) oxygenase [Blastopirellula sediminis]MCC9604404.1 2OG-Fe(II) oxygenase [Blastopirellula sediminis]MCC9626924.1 2OG-Fe(II) oxygenase [Blastopirellula sediminis]
MEPLQLNWDVIADQLDHYGCSVVDLLSPEECAAQITLFEADELFRKHVIMEEQGYGRGQYKYFVYPLPEKVAQLRTNLYPGLAAIANRWNETLQIDVRFPVTHQQFLDRCHEAGQQKPTPLLLRYEADDFNCLHQDVYGEHVFPLQVAILLSSPGDDFTGGEFVLTAEGSRMQPQAEVVPLQQGQGVIFPVRQRPLAREAGFESIDMRHGVSRLRSGRRHTLGIIFHDAV